MNGENTVSGVYTDNGKVAQPNPINLEDGLLSVLLNQLHSKKERIEHDLKMITEVIEKLEQNPEMAKTVSMFETIQRYIQRYRF